MIIRTRQRLKNLSQDINVSIDGKVLKEIETKKSLGVLIDEHLCWDKQIDNISKKASKGIGILRRVKLSNIFMKLLFNLISITTQWFGVIVVNI